MDDLLEGDKDTSGLRPLLLDASQLPLAQASSSLLQYVVSARQLSTSSAPSYLELSAWFSVDAHGLNRLRDDFPMDYIHDLSEVTQNEDPPKAFGMAGDPLLCSTPVYC